MRKRLTTICCSALALVVALSTWGTAQEQHAGFPLFPVALRWTLTFDAPLLQAPGFFGTHAVIALDNGHLTAFDLLDGRAEWTVDRKPTAAPVVSPDRVYVLEGGAVFALDLASGQPVWQIQLAAAVAAPLMAVDGWLVAIDESGQVTAYRTADGSQVWSVAAGGSVRQAAAIEGQRVYVAREDGVVSAFNIENGRAVWSRRIGGAPQPILALGDRIYVGSDDNFLYCLTAVDGKIDWRWRTGGDVIGRAAYDDQRVYIVSLDTLARGLDRQSGAQRWKAVLPFRPAGGIVAGPSALLVSGVANTVQGLTPKDGAALSAIDAGGLLAAPPHVAPTPSLPSSVVVVVARSLKSGTTMTGFTRTLEPPATPIQPLPDPNAPRTTAPGAPGGTVPTAAGTVVPGSSIATPAGQPPPGLPPG